MYQRILIAYDGSEGAKKALEHAIRLAKGLRAELFALWVRGSLPHYPQTMDEIDEERTGAESFLHKITDDIMHYAKQFGIEIHGDSRTGHPAKTIIEYAQEKNVELIVLGHRGHSGLWANLLGHTTDKVSENAHCSVLIVR
jgi:nucleotide-binding universal stress UspA family protein